MNNTRHAYAIVYSILALIKRHVEYTKHKGISLTTTSRQEQPCRDTKPIQCIRQPTNTQQLNKLQTHRFTREPNKQDRYYPNVSTIELVIHSNRHLGNESPKIGT